MTKKISLEEKKEFVTGLSEGQKDPRNLQFTTYCVFPRIMKELELGRTHPETVLNLLYTIYYFGKIKIMLL